jgi:hypothetical protein
MADITFKRESDLRARLNLTASAAELLSAGVYPAILRLAALPDCGKSALLPASIAVYVDGSTDPLPNQDLASGSLSTWEAAPLHKRAVIGPERSPAHLRPCAGSVSIDYHVGVYSPVGAGSFSLRDRHNGERRPNDIHGRRGTADSAGRAGCIGDSRTYTLISDVSDITAHHHNNGRAPPHHRLTPAHAHRALPDRLMRCALDGLWTADAVGQDVILDITSRLRCVTARSIPAAWTLTAHPSRLSRC